MKISKIFTSVLCVFIVACTLTGCFKYKGLNDTELQELPELPDYSQYIDLGAYTGIKCNIRDEDYIVSEDEIQFGMETALYSVAKYKVITDRGARKDDLVTIKYNATIDGMPFSGSSSGDTGVAIFLGHAGYIGDFEDQIVGMKTGETKDITVTFPETFLKTSFRGKDVVYSVSVMMIQEREMPEITDELVAENLSEAGVTSVQELHDVIQERLQADKDSDKYAEIYNDLILKIVNNSTIKGYPEDMLNDMVSSTISGINKAASESGMTADDFVKENYDAESMDAYTVTITDEAKMFLAKRMVLGEIARREHITITAETFTEYKTQFAVDNGYMNVNDVNIHYSDEDILLDASLAAIEDWMYTNSIDRSDNETTETTTSVSD